MIKTMIGVFAVVGLMALPQAAHAATAAGTLITNQATLTFSVGGVTQPTVSNTPNTTEAFVVDQAVDLVVATTDLAAVTVVPGQTGNVLTFSVTNAGNKVQDVILSATSANGSAAAFGGTANKDMTLPVSIFVDANGNGIYEPATDTATFIDELAAGAATTVFIVADAPNTLVNGDIASYHLLAQAAVGGVAGTQGAAETQTAPGARTLTGTDVIFADAAGSDTVNDAAFDGKHSSQDDYKVASAVISVTKSVAVVASPIPGGTDPIPGATVEYTVTISNAATATASAVLTTLNDPLNANLTAVTTANAASWTVTGSTRAVTTGTLTLDAADANADGLGLNAGSVDYNLSTILAAQAGPPAYAAGELKPGESVSVTFQATIN